MVSLKDRQIGKRMSDWFNTITFTYLLPLIISPAAIKQMLNLNKTPSKAGQLASEPVWKILIYDRVGQDIISPLISIRELRELGVTLHM